LTVPGASVAPAVRRTQGVASGAALAVAALGTLTAGSYLYAARTPMPDVSALRDVAFVQVLLFLAGAAIVLRARVSRPACVIILLTGILCRALLVPVPPRFSTDVYRYVWDGRVQAAGINPYRYAPADPALARFRDASIYPRITRRDYARTIYPPVAQMIFLAVARAGGTVTAMKAAMAAFDAATIGVLVILLGRLGVPRGRVLLYAWNPLVIWQYAGDGHVDAAAVAFVAVALAAHARRWEILTGIALGCAALVKWYPALLAPALYRPGGWRMPLAMAGVMAAAYAPYLGVGSGIVGFIPNYMQEEGLIDGHRFFLLNVVRAAGAAVPVPLFVAASLAALLAIGVWAVRRTERTALGDVRWAAALAAVFTILLSTHYVWYFGWLALFLAVVPTLPLLYLAAAPLYLFAALGPRHIPGVPGVSLFDAALYTPLALLAAADARLMSTANAAGTTTAPGGGRHGIAAPEPARMET
jgi:alpha-1,6-mannosyltransferase